MEKFIAGAVEYVETEGLTLRFYKAAEDAYRKPEHVPFTLNPIPITKKCFEKISDNQLIINKLIHLASMDQKFLEDSFQTILPNDEFWRKLFQVYTESQKHRNLCPFEFGIHRSDYLVECENDVERPLVVEINTFASGGHGHSQGINRLHRAIKTCSKEKFVQNDVMDSMVEFMDEAVRAYADHFSKSLSELSVVIVREEKGYLQEGFRLQEKLNFEVQLDRSKYEELNKLDTKSDGSIHFNGKEVALFYYRSGYDPNCYVDEKSWDHRLQIEVSRAIKLPKINYQLLTNKIFQAKFANMEILQNYLTKTEAKSILETFCETFELVDWSDTRIKNAMLNPEKFCLKIFREGGAKGNVFGSEIVPILTEMKTNLELRKKYVLMKLISPHPTNHTIIRNGAVSHNGPTITEIGIFGSFLKNIETGKVLIDSKSGHLIRTKPAESRKGGYACGDGAISSLAIEK